MKNKKSMARTALVLLVALVSLAAFAQGSLTAGTRVNINTATLDELKAIPGVGDKIAKELTDYRPYTSLEQFRTELGKYMDAAALGQLENNITLGLVNLNTATPEELAALPGVGPNIAKELAEYRPYTSVDQLRAELGKYIDAQAIANIEALSTIGLVDLNTATVTELKTVPGVGDKIASEVTDYRPYTSIAQFRAELGKYLDPQALHNLELYLTLQ